MTAHADPVAFVALALAVILATAKLGGHLAERLGQPAVLGALLVGGWSVYTEQLEIGGVVAFISGISRITDPWGDLVNYFRDVNITQVKFRLLSEAVNQQARRDRPNNG